MDIVLKYLAHNKNQNSFMNSNEDTKSSITFYSFNIV